MRLVLIKTFIILTVLGCLALAKAPTTGKLNAAATFDKVKEQIVDLLAKNQRISALNLIENESLRDDKEYKIKLNSLKFNLMNDFLLLSTQEIYETAAGVVLSDKKKALSGMQQCLAIEPENLQCRWLELKYHRRYGQGIFKDQALTFIETAQNMRQLQLLKNSLLVALDRTEEIVVSPNAKVSKALNSEESTLENIINYNLALRGKNYPKAKEILNYMNAHYMDYPDLIFMSYQLSSLWPEGVGFSENSLNKQYEVYRKKCADLPTSVARKYFFDISLCVRSL